MIYVYIHSESPDGIISELRLVEGATSIVEAKEIFIKEQIHQSKVWCGEENIKEQFLYFSERSETTWHKIIFLDVNSSFSFSMEDLRYYLATELKMKLVSLEERDEKEEYERLKLKYGK